MTCKGIESAQSLTKRQVRYIPPHDEHDAGNWLAACAAWVVLFGVAAALVWWV